MADVPPPYDPNYPGGYPPPQQGYPPLKQDYPPPAQQSATTTTVVFEQPAAPQVFGQTPVQLPDGNLTVLRYRSGLLTWILVGIICLVTLECGLCCIGLIPLCLDAAKDIEHVHPVTGQVVGVYKRI